MSESKKIILDTNFLLIPGQFKVDIFTEIQRICGFQYKLYIIDSTVNELEKILETGKMADKQAVKLALELIKSKDIYTMSSDTAYVDRAILDIADKNTFVATQDAELKQKLKDKSVGVITLRQKKYLVMV